MWVYTSQPMWEADVSCYMQCGKPGFDAGRVSVCQQWVAVCAGLCWHGLVWTARCWPMGATPRATLIQLPLVTPDSIFSLLQTHTGPLGPQGSVWPHLLPPTCPLPLLTGLQPTPLLEAPK